MQSFVDFEKAHRSDAPENFEEKRYLSVAKETRGPATFLEE